MKLISMEGIKMNYALGPLTKVEVKAIRKKLGLRQNDLAELMDISVKTVERWERDENMITGPAAVLLRILDEYPQLEEAFRIPEKKYSLRLWYYCDNQLCTLIDVDERLRKVKIYNYTSDYIMRAFGRNEKPDYTDYEAFLESRCFPESRDKMKLILEDLDLPFYDPILIIEKTKGRMAEDRFWIKIER